MIQRHRTAILASAIALDIDFESVKSKSCKILKTQLCENLWFLNEQQSFHEANMSGNTSLLKSNPVIDLTRSDPLPNKESFDGSRAREAEIG